MGWVRVDDDFYDHEKFMGLSLAGMGLWVALLAWSNRNLKDGCIPLALPQRFGADDECMAELVSAGLLEPGDECWTIHDYHDFQPSAEEVLAKREAVSAKRADAGRKGAATRWQADSKPIATVCPQPQPHTPKVKNVSAPSGAAEPYTEDFERWWVGYPRKVDKAKAFAVFKARRRDGVTLELLFAARDNYAAVAEQGFEKYPATFLYGKTGPWSEYAKGVPEAARAPMNGNQGPQPITRERNGATQRFYPGTGWI